MNVPSTPKKIWVGLGVMAAAVIVPTAGYFRVETMRGDYQPLAVLVVSFGWGVVLGIGGIACAIMGFRQKPRSLATKVALAIASLLSAPVIYVIYELVRVFTT